MCEAGQCGEASGREMMKSKNGDTVKGISVYLYRIDTDVNQRFHPAAGPVSARSRALVVSRNLRRY